MARKLRLDERLSTFLPEFPFPEKDTITIGLGDYMEHEDYQRKMAGIESIADILPLIYTQKPQFAPGERFAYSNSGMVILGAIVEKLSGLSYPEKGTVQSSVRAPNTGGRRLCPHPTVHGIREGRGCPFPLPSSEKETPS